MGVHSAEILVPQMGHSAEVNSLSFSPSGHLLASAGSDDRVRIWNGQGNVISELRGHKADVLQALFVDDSKLVSVDNDGVMYMWNAVSEQRWSLDGFSGRVPFDATQIISVENGVLLKAGRRDLKWARLNTSATDSDLVVQSIALPAEIQSAALSPSGNVAIAVNRDGWVYEVDLQSSKLSYKKKLNSALSVVRFKNEVEFIAAGDGVIEFNREQKKQSAEYKIPGFWGIFNFAYNPETQHVAALASDLNVLDLKTGKSIQTIEDTGTVAIAYSNSGELVYVQGDSGRCYADDSKIIFLDPEGQQSKRYTPGFFAYSKATVHNNMLAINGCDNKIQLWDLANLTYQGSFDGHQSVATALAFSPDGKELLSTSYDDTLRLNLLSELNGSLLANNEEAEYFSAVAFSESAQLLAYGEYDTDDDLVKVRILNRLNGQTTLLGYDFSLEIKQLLFVGQDQYLLVRDFSGNVMVFDLDNFEIQSALPKGTVHKAGVFSGFEKIEQFAYLENKKLFVTATRNKISRWKRLPWQLGRATPEAQMEQKVSMLSNIVASQALNQFATIQHRDIIIYDADLKMLKTIQGYHPVEVHYTGDGKSLVVIETSGVVSLLDPANDFEPKAEIYKQALEYGFSYRYADGAVQIMSKNVRQPVLMKIIEDGKLSWKTFP